MDFDYDEDDFDNQQDNYNNWEIIINNETINIFEDKDDAMYSLIEELNILSFYKLNDDFSISNFDNEDDLVNHFLNLSAMDFYEDLERLLERLELIDNIRLINLDNEEPEFGEL